jgi:hypothetical protein
VEELSASGYFYTNTIWNDRLKGSLLLKAVEKFKKKERVYLETVVLEEES